MAEERLYAVLSGDIVESRRYTDLGPAVRDAIKGAYQACSEEFGDAVLGIDVFRGDRGRCWCACRASRCVSGCRCAP